MTTVSDKIGLTFKPDTLPFFPGGEPVEVVITITNEGTAVDQYTVELDNLPNTWYGLTGLAVALFPGDHEDIPLTFHPPRGSELRAGSHPFTITATSVSDPAQTRRVEGWVKVHAQDPGLVGQPLENEHYTSGGFAVQRTTKGLLVVDQQDSRSYFMPHGTNTYEYDQGHERQLAGGQ